MITKRLLVRAFGRAQRPAAWVLLVGGGVTFLAVLFDLVRTGDARWATLLISADLVVSGFGAVQEAEGQVEEGGEVQ